MSTVLLEVVTPERVVLSRDVNMVTFRGGDGELGILPRHMALATTVKPGVVKVKLDEGEDFIHVSGGFVEVLPTRVTILANTAEIASAIDVDRASRAKERAEARLSQHADGIDEIRAEAALLRAVNRLKAHELSSERGHLLDNKKTVQ